MKRLFISTVIFLGALVAFAQGISNSKDLVAFASAVNAGEDISKWMNTDSVVVLTADIDMSKVKKFARIEQFTGKFDGCSHKIKGWKTDRGLFGQLAYGAEVKGIVIDANCQLKVTSSTGEFSTGFIVDVNHGKIENCENYGSVSHKCTYTAEPIHIGGIAGLNYAYILSCRNYGKIQSSNYGIEQKGELPIEVGGIAGGCSAGKKLKCPVIAWCENFGEISVSSDFRVENIGGVVGGGGRCPVKYCINRGKVHSSSYKSEAAKNPAQSRVGGIAGFTKSDISCSDNFGEVVGEGNAVGCVGGIVGMPHESLNVTDCVNYGKVVAYNENGANVGGCAGNIGRPVHLRRCINYGAVSFEGLSQKSRSTAGGVVGQVYCPKSQEAGAYIRNCANYGAVSSVAGGNTQTNANAIHTGGVVGYMTCREGLRAFLKDCRNEGTVKSIGGRRGNIAGGVSNVTTGGLFPDDNAVSAKPLEDGSNVYGTVFSDEGKPLEGIVVTDGRQCVTTAADGSFRMKSDLNEANFVYLSLPSNATVQTVDGIPQFFRRIARHEQAVKAEFILSLREPAKNYTLVMIGDPQVRPYGVDDSMEQWDGTVSTDIEAFRKKIGGDVYCINLGDLVYNFMTAYDDYIDAASKIKCPTFNVIGNHDFDQTTLFDTRLGNMFFETYICPEHYSFNIGDVHFIVMNTIMYDRKNNAVSYGNGIDDRAAQWLEEDLKYVPKDRVIVACSHAQFFKKRGDSPNGSFGAHNRNYKRYFNAMKPYKQIYSVSGHYHNNFYFDYSGKKLRHGSENIKSLTVARCTGGLRLNKYLSGSGTPQGYLVMNVKGQDFDWYYKAVGHDKDYQMRTFTPLKTGDGFVKVNIWNWSEGWSTPQWYENGVCKGEMEFHPEFDPEYLDIFAGVTNKTTRKYCKPTDRTYMFRITPSQGVTSGEIRVKDLFGNEYSTSVSW